VGKILSLKWRFGVSYGTAVTDTALVSNFLENPILSFRANVWQSSLMAASGIDVRITFRLRPKMPTGGV